MKKKLRNITVGSTISIEIRNKEVVKGEIFSYDPHKSALVIYESGKIHESSTRCSFKIVNTKEITNIISYSSKKEPIPYGDTNKPLPPVNNRILKERLEESLRERSRVIGRNVTNKARTIFNNLNRSLDCYWKEDTIIVMNEDVVIKKPYTLDEVEGKDEAKITRVKTMLKGILEQLNKL